MATEGDAAVSEVVVSYSPVSDVVSCQIGTPVPTRMARVDADLCLFVARDDPEDARGFELRTARSAQRRQVPLLQALFGARLVGMVEGLLPGPGEGEPIARVPTRPDRFRERTVTRQAALSLPLEERRSIIRETVERAWRVTVEELEAETPPSELVSLLDEWLSLAARWEAVRVGFGSPRGRMGRGRGVVDPAAAMARRGDPLSELPPVDGLMRTVASMRRSVERHEPVSPRTELSAARFLSLMTDWLRSSGWHPALAVAAESFERLHGVVADMSAGTVTEETTALQEAANQRFADALAALEATARR